jgi:hypothetical protein
MRRKGNLSAFLGHIFMLVLESMKGTECWKKSTNHVMLKENHCWVGFYVENEVVGLL